MSSVKQGIRAAQTGMLINAGLAGIKLAAGIAGNTYALVADAVESGADVFSSMLVWGGLAVAAQPADERHPYGYGKAEAIAAAAVSLMLLGAAIGIGIEAVKEIRTPHLVPAPWTLAVEIRASPSRSTSPPASPTRECRWIRARWHQVEVPRAAAPATARPAT